MNTIKGWELKKEHYCLGAAPSAKKREKILKDLFRKYVGYEPNFQNPCSFNEKIMWYKLYYHDPQMTECADKYAVKNYVERTVGIEHAVKTLAVWDTPDDIDFDILPEKFVLKVNWSSGYYIIVTDKAHLDKVEVRNKLNKWLTPARCSYFEHFNWAYKNIKPVVYAEEYLEQSDGQVTDYKFFMCGGELGFTLIVNNRKSETSPITMDYFDENFNHYDLVRSGSENADVSWTKPEKYDEMVYLAKKLAAPFPFVRVDFYQLDGRVLLGEMTFYTAGGLKPFIPQEWDFILGEKIPIPNFKIIEKESTSQKIINAMKRILSIPMGKAGIYLAHRHHVILPIKRQSSCINSECLGLSVCSRFGAPQLRWHKDEKIYRYKVFYKTHKGYRLVFYGDSDNFTHYSAVPYCKNKYLVNGLDSNGNVICSDFIKLKSKLASPRVKSKKNSSGKPLITWNRVSGAAYYLIFRTDYSKNPIFVTSKCRFTNISATAGKEYKYFVVAVDILGRHSCRSRITSVHT